MEQVFGIIDCNNFYVSCERVFRPDLEGVPASCYLSRHSTLPEAFVYTPIEIVYGGRCVDLSAPSPFTVGRK
jgi:hypothetical protein